MNYTIGLITLFSIVILSACMTTSSNLKTSFETSSANGDIGTSLSQTRSGKELIDGNGYAYAAGKGPDYGFQAVAGVIPGSDMGVPIYANATYTGEWELAKISSIYISGNEITGFIGSDGGSITLNANFAEQTLTGSDGLLEVNGTMNGNNLSGSVIFNGTTGELTGLVGEQGAVGAFHGEGDTQIYAGGFLVD